MFLIIFILHFSVDIFLIYYFQSRALIPEIFTFTKEVAWSDLLINWFICLFLFVSLILMSFFISQYLKIKIRYFISLFIIWLFCYISIITIFRNRDIRFFWNILTMNSIFRLSNWFSYENYKNLTPDSLYSDYIQYGIWEWKNVNIVLVFAESLSAIDSKKYWWYDNMPWFDTISDKWITYINFISNWSNSESAHVATLLWVLPYTYNSYSWYKYILEPLPKYLNKLWYNTTFISAVSLNFLNQFEFIKWIWFNKIIWDEEFLEYNHYSFNAASDEDLFKRTIKEIENQTWKYFIWLQTISYHSPFLTPYWNTQELALKFSDNALYKFYKMLDKNKFFDNWILIILWDHRSMWPMKENEERKMWTNWYTRTVATVVWSWIKKWEINNNIIQHTDFYNSLKLLIGTWQVEFDSKYNDCFSWKINRSWWITLNPTRTLWQDEFTISYLDSSYTFNKISKGTVKDKYIYDYLWSYLKFQTELNKNVWKIMDIWVPDFDMKLDFKKIIK